MQEIPQDDSVLRRLLAGYILFLFSIQVITIGISLCQWRISAWRARGVLAAAVAIAVGFFSAGWKRGEVTPAIRNLRRWDLLSLGFLGMTGLVYLFLWAAAYVMPDRSYDGNAYHIPAVAMWDAEGYICWVKTTYKESLINGYPKATELVAYVIVKAFSNQLINAVNLIFLPLGVVGIAVLARLLGARPLLALCAGAAFLLIPLNVSQSVTTYVDTAYASCAIGLVAMLICLTEAPEPDWKDLFAFGAAIGLALGVKSTGFALGGLAVLALVVLWLTKIVLPVRGGPAARNRGKALLGICVPLLLILVASLAGGGYWYIRNYIATGTPLYPVGVTIHGHTVFPGISASKAIGEDSNTPAKIARRPVLVRPLYTWAQGLRDWPDSLEAASGDGYDSREAGLGFLWLLGCVPAILIVVLVSIRQKLPQRRALLVLLMVIGISFLVTPMNWWARYTVWIYALGLPCLGFVVSRSLFRENRSLTTRMLSWMWLALCVAMLLYEGGYSVKCVAARASPGPLRQSLVKMFQPGTWTWPTSYLFPEMRKTPIERILTLGGTVAIGPENGVDSWHYAGLVGELCQPIGARKLIFIGEEFNPGDQALLQDARYVIWDKTLPLPRALAALASQIEPAAEYVVLTLPER